MPLPVDFQLLFERSPSPYMVLDRELRYVAANAAYLKVTASTLDGLLGRHVLEMFPHDPADPANASARTLRESFERVLATGQPDTLALISYRVPRKLPSGEVVDEVRYWSATHTPIPDAQGQVAYLLQHTEDVTELELLRRSVGEGGDTARLEQGVLGRARQVQEANLRLERDRLELLDLFEQAPGFVAFLRGPEHLFVLANDAYQRLVGGREILGKTVRQALPELVGQGFYELLDRVFQSEQPFVGRGLRAVLRDVPGGPTRDAYVDFIYQPIRGADGQVSGILVQGHDITEQKLLDQQRTAAEEELRQSEERSRALVAALTEGVMLQDREGRILDVNASALRMLGRTREELMGTVLSPSTWKLIREDGSVLPEEEQVARMALYSGQPQLQRVVGVVGQEGQQHWLQVSAQPLFDRDGTTAIAVVSSFSDITERKLRQEFEQQLIGIVSHDLRNPVSAMLLSATSLMKREKLDPLQLNRGLARIVNSGERAARLIRDLLDFTQARLGTGIPVHPRPVSLEEVARATLEEVQQAHPERELRWRAEGDSSGNWDPDRLAQIITNLAANALAYSPPETPVEVEVIGRADQASLVVRNRGTPIAVEMLPVLFQPYRRGRDVHPGAAGSIGLGLFIVDQLVRAHRGRIGVRSNQEEGTTFTVVLPRD